MGEATFRFHGDLDELLPAARRGAPVVHAFDGRPAVKDAIEALGVPHPEVDAILVDGRPVGFGHPLGDGAVIDVLPAGARPDIPAGARTGPPPQNEPRFALDGHLGRLARHLRMLGFDAWYRRDADDEELAVVSHAEDRILLTRDRALLRRGLVVRGRYVRSDRPTEQLRELVDRYALATTARPFTRCLRCGGRLEAVDRERVLDRLEPLTRRYFREFARCPGCDRVYWQGSHHARMSRVVEAAIGRRAADAGPAGPGTV
jgi:uncharacterized protein with PIN domain